MLTIEQVAACGVVPVVVLEDAEQAVPTAKALLAGCILERHPEKYLISGSGMAGIGPANEMVTKKITSRFILCGDGESDVDKSDVLLGTRVMLCAAHQAHAALRIIAGAK